MCAAWSELYISPLQLLYLGLSKCVRVGCACCYALCRQVHFLLPRQRTNDMKLIASLMIQGSAALVTRAVFSSDEFTGELRSSFGIDIHIPATTPLDEIVKVDVHLFDKMTLRSEALESLFGGIEPFIIGIVLLLGIYEGGFQFIVTFTSIPSHSSGSNLHLCDPLYCGGNKIEIESVLGMAHNVSPHHAAASAIFASRRFQVGHHAFLSNVRAVDRTQLITPNIASPLLFYK
jgi:hypothetical protein